MSLQRRITAGRALMRETSAHPAHFVAFDRLQERGTVLLAQPLSRRRRRLERLLASAPPPLPVCPQTNDEQTALSWYTDGAAAGIEGIVLKTATSRYQLGGTAWRKMRSRHTIEAVIGGVTGNITHPSSLLLGQVRDGRLRYLTQTHPLKAAQRRELARLLTPMAFHHDPTHPWPCPFPPAGQRT